MVCLYGRLPRETCHQFRAVCLYQLSLAHNAQRPEDIRHDTGNSGLSRSGITCEDIVLALERIGLSTFDLQIQESGQIGHLFLHSTQSDQTVEFGQTI